MKVLYVSKALHVAAYRTKLRDLARHVEVRGLIPERWGSQLPEPGCDELVSRAHLFLHGHNHLHVYRSARRPLARFKPDFVHIDEEPYSAATVQWVHAAGRAGVPCLFFAWQNIDRRLPLPFGRLRRYVFHHVAGGVAGTSAAADVLRANGYDGPLVVVPQFGVDPERFGPDASARAELRERVGAHDGQLVVGYGGRLVREKGLAVLLDAIARVEDAILVVAGEGPLRAALQSRAWMPDLAGRVHLLGAVASTAMPAFLAGVDVLALPSLTTATWKEQFGRVAVEAMACGVPVIGSDSGEIPDVVGDGGVIVPEGDVAALAEAISALRAAPERRRTLGTRGRALVLERYTGERIAERTAAFYRELAC